ncbi:glycoside hydrolase family 15 protein [Zhaonella formicivorans]|uniref:glycoside hydrolase family 15 protein n=1 Tax=Zhaonella formicivorans TaxID=2528593 RepID=UPI0010E4660B|nr:glycoside hydrolase family 15 protein [Zhaonella formicivorans]
MPREIVLGNGHMLVNFDAGLNMRDLYFPYIGWENHIGGNRNSTGVWVEGKFSWIDEKSWLRHIGYLDETLVSSCSAFNEGMGVKLTINDAVHFRHDLFLKKVRVTNLGNSAREIRIFFTHDFCIDGTEVGDTAAYDPALKAIYHYKRNRYFLTNGQVGEDGIYQYAVGTKRFGGAEGTWRDAEDGRLEGNPIAQGSVDSTISFRLYLEPEASQDLYYWIAVGRSYNEVREGNNYVLKNTPAKLLRKITDYWRTWVNKTEREFADLPQRVVDLYKKSLLIVRTQVDSGGAIIAANDSDILKWARDHYSYMWPRDGALVAHALDKAGYPEVTTSFYRFCRKVLTEEGYLLHKYNPDGSLGSSWHPWYNQGKAQLPIQEDETALVLISLWHYYVWYKDFEFIDTLYKPLIRKAAEFMVDYREPATGLPKESYDLWEERRGVFTFTASAVYGGLMAAANFAKLFGDFYLSDKYEQAAEEMRGAILKHLYSPELGRFLRGVYVSPDGTLKPDLTLESSLFGVFAFGVLPADDPRVVQTMRAIQDGLWVKTEIGGIARYTNDYYFQKSHDVETVPGNPWFICTLWLAQWYIAIAKSEKELNVAKTILDWVADHSLESGVLPEQLHPYTGEPLSVAPLTWSHSTLILAVLDYLDKYREINKYSFPEVHNKIIICE